MKKIKFYNENFDNLNEKIKNKKFGNKVIFNFLNSHDLYHFKKNLDFQKSLENKKKVNLIDGFFISFLLSLKKFKRIKRIRGPSFTHNFLKSEISKNKTHFFMGSEKEDLDKLSKKYFLKRNKLFYYNPPFIENYKFPETEIKKISQEINKIKPDYVWIGIASPKQNILASDLIDKIQFKSFFIYNIGAGLDFALEKKKQAPKFVQNLGLEWSYRLITDFKYTKKKVWRSLIGSFYGLNIVETENEK